MTQVFVSYAREDLRVALPLIEAIGQTGLNVWHPGAISPEGSFVEQGRRELESAQCVVLLWSKAAAQSGFVQQEIRQAIQAWSSDRLVLAALDDAALPVGLRDLSAFSIRGASDSGTKQPCLSGYYPHPQHVGCCPATGQVVAEAARPTCRVFGWTPDRQTKTIRSAACASAP